MTDKELFAKFENYCNDHGWTADQSAKSIGATRPSFFNWKKGGAISSKFRQAMITLTSYDKVTPYANQVQIMKSSDLHSVPVLSSARAAEEFRRPFGTCFDEAEVGESCYFASHCDDCFSVKIAGNSMLPWYPAGTFLLVSRIEKPRTGDRVVASVSDYSDLLFKIYVDLGGEFALLSINQTDGVKPLIFDKMDKGNTWFCVMPVLESIRNERNLDAAMTASGITHFWEKWELEYKKGK